MTFKLNQYIDSSKLVNKVINDDIRIENNIIYITLNDIEFKYESYSYYQKLINNRWVNLHSGVPDYTLDSDSNPDENIFYELEE